MHQELGDETADMVTRTEIRALHAQEFTRLHPHTKVGVP